MLSGRCDVRASAGCRLSPMADGVPRVGETLFRLGAAWGREMVEGKGFRRGKACRPREGGATSVPRAKSVTPGAPPVNHWRGGCQRLAND